MATLHVVPRTPDISPSPTTEGGSGAPSVDDTTRASLQVIAESAILCTGFEAAAISVLHPDGALHRVAVAGSRSARTALGQTGLGQPEVPYGLLLDELARGERWGHFTFVPHELVRSGEPAGWVPLTIPSISSDLTVATPLTDAWHQLDVLVAPFHDESGTVLGMLLLDVPHHGRRPDEAQRVLLESGARLTHRAITEALSRQQVSNQLRQATQTRTSLRKARRTLSLEGAVAEIGRQVLHAFGCTGLWARTFETETDDQHDIVLGNIALPEDERLLDESRRALPVLWERHWVGVIEAESTAATPLGGDGEFVRSYLRDNGYGSIAYAAVGSGQSILGSMVMVRPTGAPPWTPFELELVYQMGHELGAVLLTTMTYEREQRTAHELQQLDSYKSELIATVSHELKNPLSAILGNLELLDDVDLAPDIGRRSITSLDRSTQRMVQIVNELRELADVDRPAPPRRAAAVDLRAIAGNVIDLIQISAEQRSLDLTLQAGPGEFLAVGDHDELDRLVVNLLSNAVKYTPDGGSVTLALTAAEGKIVLTVLDSGIGIAPEDLDRVFTEFFRAEDPSAREQPGTGLGLTIVDRIVKRHGGKISVKSEVGTGTMITVTLPQFVRAGLTGA